MYFKTPIAHQVPTMIETLTNNFLQGSETANYRLTSLSFDKPSFKENSIGISFTYYTSEGTERTDFKICKFEIKEDGDSYRIYPEGPEDDDQWEKAGEFLNGLVDLEAIICNETIKPKYKH